MIKGGDRQGPLLVARAATGIYAILKANMAGAEVIVPANICPAAVYPIVYSGNVPVFCDVSIPLGNATIEDILQVTTPRTACVLLPHMYGSVNADILHISRFCKGCGILLIEDCASSMGASLSGTPIGSWGDYAVFSTGHGKVLDLGGGGLVYGLRARSEIRDILNRLPSLSNRAKVSAMAFARVYRKFLNTRVPLREFPERQFFRSDFRDFLIYRSSEPSERHIMSTIQTSLRKEVARRWRSYRQWSEYVANHAPRIVTYRYENGSVPWRFSFFVNPAKRQVVADRMLQEKLPVSDWYPAIAELFGDDGAHPNAELMGRSILNMPLFVSTQVMSKTCEILNSITY